MPELDTSASFGVWLRQRRRTLDMTQEALAQCAGCSVSAIRKIEADERRPSRQVAELLADCLKLTPTDRPIFLQVARAEIRVERLEGVSPLPSPFVRADSPPEILSSPSLPAPQHAQNKLRSATALPVPATPLLGREHELAGIAQLLANPQCRLLTLLGPGGIGKTRLALAAAAQTEASFRDGVYFVPLAPLNAAEFIAPAIINAVGEVFQGQADPQTQLLHYLQEKQILLVLDNIEHLLPDPAGGEGQTINFLAHLLQQAAHVKLLATSRERLNLQGEWVFEVQGLPVPPPEQRENLTHYSAVALFLQTARRSLVGFEISASEQPYMVRICELVEGLPLGIELAAAWVRLLSCREIAEEIERSLDFLTASLRDTPTRHRSLRVVFDYSWRLLSAEEQEVMQHLSLFRGGFEREAAQQVAGATLPVLSALLDKSLLRRNAARRYQIHELVRQYAQEQLQAAGALTQAQDRHLAYFAALAEEAEGQLERAEQVTWLERLEQEHDNLRVALAWAFEPLAGGGQVELGLRLASALYRFWQGRGHLREGCTWLERGLNYEAAAPAGVRAKALNVLGWLLNQQGQRDQALHLLHESLALHRQLADARGTAYTLDSLGDVAWLEGNFEQGKAYYEESLALFRTLGDQWAIGLALYSLGRLHLDHELIEPAATLLEEGLVVLRQVGDRRGIALSLLNLGRVWLSRGNYERARRQIKESLSLFYELGNKVDMAECFQVLSNLARIQGQSERTARLWAAGETLYESLGIPAISTLNQAFYKENIAFARSSLGEATFAAVWADGQAMSLAQAVAYALAEQ